MPVEGIVADAKNSALANASVYLHDPATGIQIYGINSDANGYFAFPDVAEKEYQIRITASGLPDQWWYNGQNTVFRQYRTLIDIALTTDTLRLVAVSNPLNNIPNNTFTIHIVDSTGAPLQNANNITVNLERKLDHVRLQPQPLSATGTVVFDTLQAADYFIFISGNQFFPQYYSPGRNTVNASEFTTIEGGTSTSLTVPVADPPLGDAYLNGVCRSETDAPLSGVTVSLCVKSDTMRILYAQKTDTKGFFSFAGLIDSEFFFRVEGAGYPPQWFSFSRNATTVYPDDMLWPMHFAADTMLVHLTTSPINNPAIGSISIRITDSTGIDPVTSGSVYVINTADNSQLSPGYDTLTKSYRINNIPSANYTIKLDFPPYPTQFYSPFGTSLQPSSPLYVSPNAVMDLYIQLSKNPGTSTTSGAYGFITGIVADSTGTPLSNAIVTIFDMQHTALASTTTSSSGTVSAIRLPSQEVSIEVQYAGFPTQYWSYQGMTFSMLSQNMVYIPANDTLFFDALISNSQGTSTSNTVIKGFVKDIASAKPIPNTRIVLFDNIPGQNFNAKHIWSPWVTYTDSTGMYTLQGVQQGNYRCMAEAESLNYVTQFYKGHDLPQSANVISVDPVTGVLNIDFSLRKGGTLKGLVTDMNGTSIAGAFVQCANIENTRWFETLSDNNGVWQITGLSKSTWNVWVDHDKYIVSNDTIPRVYSVSEGMVTPVQTYRMQPGGFIAGTFTSPHSLYDTTLGSDLLGGALSLFSKDITSKDALYWPTNQAGLHFQTSTTDGLSGSINSSITVPGTYVLCYTPRGTFDNSIGAQNAALLPGFGYSFIGTSSSSSSPVSFTIPVNDTLKGVSLPLRRGFRIFGTMKTEAGTLLSNNFGIDVFVKKDSTLYRIAGSHPVGNGNFEIPGMVDSEDYFFQLSAEGYPPQFWASAGNTSSPQEFFHFTAATYTPLAFTILRNPQGVGPMQMQGPISLWIEGDSLGKPLLSWSSDPGFSFDKFSLFRQDRNGTLSLITTIAASALSTTYRYRDVLGLAGFREYIITGTGPAVTIRSNPTGFDPRFTNATNTLWIDAFVDKHGIQIEWGPAKEFTTAPTDSISLFRSTGTDPAKLLFKVPVWSSMINDYRWDHADSGKTYTYHLEWPAKNIASTKATITLNAAFFAALPKTYFVGPYERYQRISDAVNAAADFDRIEVRSGTYKENLSLGGKLLTIDGAWDNGTPPVLDGGGATAITIPFVTKSHNWIRPRIQGIAFKNCATAIKSYATIEVEQCLFENVSLAVAMAVDSAAIQTALRSNPFQTTLNEAALRHCTFIARKAGNLLASVTSAGIAEQSSYTGVYTGFERFYISPLVSASTKASIELSNIAFYAREGLQTIFPVTVQGRTSSIRCSRNNIYKTATALRSGAIMIDTPMTAVDPLFVDSIWWFIQPSSPLAGNSYDTYLGYDLNKSSLNNGPNTEVRPSPVGNVTATTVGLTSVLVRWSASPAIDNVIKYHVYRAPGDPSRYFINQKSQWELNVPKDSALFYIDSFTTTATAFLDTTAVPGTPYLYVVSAVNAAGADGEIALPAPPDISTYFVNSLPDRKLFKADQWQMAGAAGATLSMAPDSRNILYGWDDKRTPDKLFANYVKTTSMQSTRGYWFKPVADTQLTFNRSSLSSLAASVTTTAISLAKGSSGWNMVSSPFPFTVSPSWLSSYAAWEWNSDSLGYRRAKTLVPWRGYWIHTEKDTSLVIWKKQPLSAYLASPLAKVSASAVLWQLTLTLRSGNSFDTDNHIGALSPALAKTGPLSLPEPPAAFGGARLFIVDTSSSPSTAEGMVRQLATLNKTLFPFNKLLEWTIGIGASENSATLSVNDLSQLPEGWHLFWIERDRQIELDRTASSIDFPASTHDHYGILVATSDRSLLGRYHFALSIGSAIASAHGPVTISYTIPYQWDERLHGAAGKARKVSINLYDIAGRKIVSLVNGTQLPGTYRAVWNRRNGSGQAVATGVYFIRLHFAEQYKTARFFNVQ